MAFTKMTHHGFLIIVGHGIRADRELLAVAYDTMARRSEFVAIDVEDVSFMEDGSGRVIIQLCRNFFSFVE